MSPFDSSAGAVFAGIWRFAVVSVFAFSIWAQAAEFRHATERDVFLGVLLAFLVGSQIFMRRFVYDRNPLGKFNATFVPAFFVYAIVWCAAWFGLRSVNGKLAEVAGSLLGAAAFAWVLGKRLKADRDFGAVIVFVAIAHTVGYFLGSELFNIVRNPPISMKPWNKEDVLKIAKMSWGFCYGIGFGAGIGYAFHMFQRRPLAPVPE